jgi:two-component sensor histidine kinase
MTGLSIKLQSARRAPLEARRAIHERLSDSLPQSVTHDLCVIVSELVRNSVEHAPGDAIQLRIEVAAAGATLRGEVEDEGHRMASLLEDQPGLGLLIVEALAERWGAYAGSTHVWFELSWE